MLLRKALAIYRSISGPESPRTALALFRLGELQALAGRTTEARSSLEEECLRIRRAKLKVGDAAIAETEAALAALPGGSS